MLNWELLSVSVVACIPPLPQPLPPTNLLKWAIAAPSDLSNAKTYIICDVSTQHCTLHSTLNNSRGLKDLDLSQSSKPASRISPGELELGAGLCCDSESSETFYPEISTTICWPLDFYTNYQQITFRQCRSQLSVSHHHCHFWTNTIPGQTPIIRTYHSSEDYWQAPP